MLTRKTPANNNDLFQVPFSGSLTWIDYVNMYPNIITEMDGTCRENCLSFYYEKNVVNQAYEFRDEDAEMDIADILGIDMNITVEGESIQEKETRMSKSCNNIEALLDEIIEENEIIEDAGLGINRTQTFDDLSDYKQVKEDKKRAKKERRQQKLMERTIVSEVEYSQVA